MEKDIVGAQLIAFGSGFYIEGEKKRERERFLNFFVSKLWEESVVEGGALIPRRENSRKCSTEVF